MQTMNDLVAHGFLLGRTMVVFYSTYLRGDCKFEGEAGYVHAIRGIPVVSATGCGLSSTCSALLLMTHTDTRRHTQTHADTHTPYGHTHTLLRTHLTLRSQLINASALTISKALGATFPCGVIFDAVDCCFEHHFTEAISRTTP